MQYRLQSLHALMAAHPDRAEPLRRHVEALELSIEAQPAFCLQNVRTLFEAAHATIAPQLGVTFAKGDGFPLRMRGVIAALDFSVANHPEAERINTHVRELTQAIEDMAVSLAKLSNIPNLRHGGSLDWGTLERQHALMLGGLCDTLVSFLFDVAWRRPVAPPAEPELSRYEDFETFNVSMDADYGDIEIAGSVFQPSKILYLLDNTQYEAVRLEWEAEQATAPDQEGATL